MMKNTLLSPLKADNEIQLNSKNKITEVISCFQCLPTSCEGLLAVVRLVEQNKAHLISAGLMDTAHLTAFGRLSLLFSL